MRLKLQKIANIKVASAEMSDFSLLRNVRRALSRLVGSPDPCDAFDAVQELRRRHDIYILSRKAVLWPARIRT
jgi:hypothetical protein